jgi:hypothetical protein
MKKNDALITQFKSIDFDRLHEMVKNGQMSLLTQEHGKITGVMSAFLVNTTEEEAWKFLLNYEKYSKFLPGIQSAKVLSRCGNTVTVLFVAGVKVMGVGGTVRYTYKLETNKPYTDTYDAATGELSGYWAILPTPNKKQVILVHADAAKDVSAANLFLKFLIDKLPTAEIGLNISPVVMIVNRMAHHMEQVHKK